jgi:hypothetical protein
MHYLAVTRETYVSPVLRLLTPLAYLILGREGEAGRVEDEVFACLAGARIEFEGG